MKICLKNFCIISPYSSKLPNGQENAKNYPYWEEVVVFLKSKGLLVVQIGVKGERLISNSVDEFLTNLSFAEILDLLNQCVIWLAVDNFLQHLARFTNPLKPGIVIWGKSDPLIFGYKENINVLKGRKYLRKNQFDFWVNEPYDYNVFVKPKVIIRILQNILENM